MRAGRRDCRYSGELFRRGRAAGEFGLEVFAQRLGNDAGFAKVVKIGGVDLWQKGEDGSQRRAGSAD